MPMFTKKPITVDMIQWDGDNLDEVLVWAHNVRDGSPLVCSRSGALGRDLRFHCAKSQSEPTIVPGDWIARETDGAGFYPIEQAVQADTYGEAGFQVVPE